MKEQLFSNDELRQQLTNSLPGAADYITETGARLRRLFPGLVWATPTLWALGQYADLRESLCKQIREKKAEEMQLVCSYGELNPSEEIRLNRKLVEMSARADISAISGFSLAAIEPYLRCGALSIDAAGNTITAPNAAALIADYCAVFVESAQEKEFVQSLAALKDAAQALEGAHANLCKCVCTAAGKKALEGGKHFYSIHRLPIGDNLRLADKDAIFRAFVAYCIPLRKREQPHFYNAEGRKVISIAELYALTGYKPQATAALRLKFPELYKAAPFRGYFSSQAFGNDNPATLEELRGMIEAGRYSIDETGEILV